MMLHIKISLLLLKILAIFIILNMANLLLIYKLQITHMNIINRGDGNKLLFVAIRSTYREH